MALPTIERNWIFTRSGGASTLNQIIKPQAWNWSDNKFQRLYPLWLFKDTLVNFSSGPWTVVQSKNAAGTWGNADYWTTAATALWTGGTSGGWIVLQNTFAGRTAQILIKTDYWNCSGYVLITTGTLFPASIGGADPVPPTDVLRWDNLYNSGTANNQLITSSDIGTYRMNVMQTWDSGGQGVESLRFSMYRAGSRYLWGFWDKVKDVPTGSGLVWDYPEVAIWGPNGNYSPTWTDMSNSLASHFVWGKSPGLVTPMGARFVSQSLNTADAVVPFVNSGIKNSLVDAYELSPISIIGQMDPVADDIDPVFGRLGTLVDFWIGSQFVGEGVYFPVGSPQFYKIGHFVWPWDSTQLPPQLT